MTFDGTEAMRILAIGAHPDDIEAGCGGALVKYMRIFGQESLGRPDAEIESETNALRKFFAKHMNETEIPTINTMMVFTSDKIELESVEDAPIPAMKVKEIKEFFKKKTSFRFMPFMGNDSQVRPLAFLPASLLFGVPPLDVATFAVAGVALVAVAALSAALPAARAARIDPVKALRQE